MIVLGGVLYAMLRLETGPATTTLAPAATTTLATSTTTSTTTTTPPTATTPAANAASSPVFRSSTGPVDPSDVASSWREGCPLEVESLRAVDLSHFGYDGEVHTGRLVVANEVAADIVEIFGRLFKARFPIERMEPVDVYDGDDDLSMAANNTSAFNCRPVTGGSSWSEHSYGSAIDVNPLVNPYVIGATVLPPEGNAYADRNLDAPGMIHDGDVVVETFAAHGWIWGGTWSSPKDYQHFSTSGR